MSIRQREIRSFFPGDATDARPRGKGGNRNDPREFFDPMEVYGVWRVHTDHAGGVDVPPITRFRRVRGASRPGSRPIPGSPNGPKRLRGRCHQPEVGRGTLGPPDLPVKNGKRNRDPVDRQGERNGRNLDGSVHRGRMGASEGLHADQLRLRPTISIQTSINRHGFTDRLTVTMHVVRAPMRFRLAL